MNITVDVTKKDIEQGQPRQACYCPVALAVKRSLPVDFKFKPLTVTHYNVAIHLPGGGREFTAKLPDDVAVRIVKFDSGKGMKKTW